MAYRGWLTRERFLIFVLLTVPRCTCNGCAQSNDSGCGSGYSGGGGDCDSTSSNTCPAPVPGTHTISNDSSGWFGGGTCTLTCEPGWSDCDGLSSNGCETAGPCPTLKDASPLPTPTLVATLTGAPHGLAACGDLYFFDDDMLEVVHGGVASTVLQSNGVPSGGIACDSTTVYWPTLATATATGTLSGYVWALPFGKTAAQPFAGEVDPGRGIEVQAGRVYWIARSGFGDAGSMLAYTTLDGGSLALMPATESPAYKAFALSYDGQYSLSGGAIWFAGLDAGPTILDADASAASALLAGAGGTFAVVHGQPSTPLVDASADANDDASADAGDDASGDGATDAGADADATPLAIPDYLWSLNGTSPKAGPLGRIVATTASGSAVVASDDTVYVVDLPTGTVQVVWSPALHIVDVATDGTYAYWTTLGEGTVAGGVWKMKLP